MATNKNEVLIEGRLYDISKFKHPGGGVMKFHAGHGDATEAFYQYHMTRKTNAKKMLDLIPSRAAPAPPNNAEEQRKAKLSADFARWVKQLEKEGWFDCSPMHMVYRFLDLIVLHMLGLYLCFATQFWYVGLAILGFAEGRCGWLMHEGGHFSMFGNVNLDRHLADFLFGFGCGMSGAWWRIQHNKHHTMPQKLHHDADLDTLPLVAFNKKCAMLVKDSYFAKLWIPLQAYCFAPITCSLVAISWQLILHPRFIWRRKRVTEFFWIALRLFCIYSLMKAANLSWPMMLGVYLYHNFWGAMYIFTNFSLNHSHLPVSDPDEVIHWVEYANAYTCNVTPNFFVDYWMGYLNYQIEHHLFPTMPQYRFVQLSPQTAEFFKSHGLKYDVRGYFEAWGEVFNNLDIVGASLR